MDKKVRPLQVFSTESCCYFTCKSRAKDSNSDSYEPNKRILLYLEKERNDMSHPQFEEIKVIKIRIMIEWVTGHQLYIRATILNFNICHTPELLWPLQASIGRVLRPHRAWRQRTTAAGLESGSTWGLYTRPCTGSSADRSPTQGNTS